MIKKITAIIFLGLILVGCFNKETSCTVNGLVIDASIKGMDRDKIIETIGTSNLSALEVKGFEDYIYEFNGKKYGISLHYELINNRYLVSNYKCIKVEPKIELFDHVLWH